MRDRCNSLLQIFSLIVAMAVWPGQQATALNPNIELRRYTKQVWSTESGLPQNSAHAVLQTSDGFLWVATEGGLARFDGYQFLTFNSDSNPRLPGNDVRSLMEDRSGALWVGTEAGVTRLKDGKTQTFTTANGLPSNAIRTILQSKDRALWVLTSAGVAVAAGGEGDLRFHAFSTHDGMLSDSVVAIVADAQTGIWVGTSKGLNRIQTTRVESGPGQLRGTPIDALQGITDARDGTPGSLLIATPDAVLQLANGTLSPLANRAALPTGGVRSLLATREGVWAAGKNMVTLIRPRGIQTFTTGNQLPGQQVYSIVEDRHGSVWIGTNSGLTRWSQDQMQTGAGRESLTFPGVLSIYEDHENNLWVGTETGGLSLLRNPLFEIIGRQQGLAEESVSSIVQAADRSLWVGTNGGGLSRVDMAHNLVHSYTAKDTLASDTVLALAPGVATSGHPSNLNSLWVGTPDGLNLYRDGRWQLYTSADGLADDLVRSLLVARNGDLWIGTRHGVTQWRNGHGTTWAMADGLGSDLVGAMLEDRNGDLWIGTLGGLSRFHNGKIINFIVADGLPGATITALAEDSEGTLWVGTNGQGLARWDGQHFFSFAKTARLPRDIYSILMDDAGSMWLSSGRGIHRIRLAELDGFRDGRSTEIAVANYGTADGLPSLEGAGAGHPSAGKMADGRLGFASRRGVILFDPKNLTDPRFSPPVVVEQITIDGRDASVEELTSIAPGASHLSFAFAGISFAAPQQVQYRYMLEGFDKDWVDAGMRRSAFYTNLAPGSYRFRVSARMAGGPWSQIGAEIALKLRPHYYQTVLFRVILLLAVAALIFGIYLLRVRALQSRFDAIGAERSRLARDIHDTLAQSFVAVSVRLELMAQLLRKQKLDDCGEQLNQTRDLVREALAEARRSIWDLRAEGADAMTLPVRLARVVKQTNPDDVTLRFEITGTYRPLDRVVEDELFRITQEAIANAIRHAHARTVQVKLTYVSELAMIEVADDGRGFDVAHAPAAADGHFGLIGMRERAQKIGADMKLESFPGQGTRMQVEKRLSIRDKTPQDKKIRKDVTHV